MNADRLKTLAVALLPYSQAHNASPEDLFQAARRAVPDCTDDEVVVVLEWLSEFLLERAAEMASEAERRGVPS